MMTTIQIDEFVAHDPVLRRILDGEASSLRRAEDQYLDDSLPEIFGADCEPA